MARRERKAGRAARNPRRDKSATVLPGALLKMLAGKKFESTYVLTLFFLLSQPVPWAEIG